MSHTFTPFPSWKPVTERELDPAPVADPAALEFVLTPYERDQAATYAVELERQRRERNRKDDDKGFAADFARAVEGLSP